MPSPPRMPFSQPANHELPKPVMPSGEILKLLKGQKAIVTGASSGIGRAIALALGHAGADVCINYVSSADDAQAMVVLANAYWLTGRGPDAVGTLAARAKDADSGNRGAWHLWALSEPDLRVRVERWRQVSRQFPQDQLARAALADNAASLASAQDDPAALDLAIQTYQALLAESARPEQRLALEGTLKALKTR